MKRISFKVLFLVVLILGIFILMIGVYKTDSLNISNLDRQEKIIKIQQYYNFKWGPSNLHLNEDLSPKISSTSHGRNIRSSSDLNNENNLSCQSTVQGSLYIADDQGYVCLRSNWDSITKCCKKQDHNEINQDSNNNNNSNINSNSENNNTENNSINNSNKENNNLNLNETSNRNHNDNNNNKTIPHSERYSCKKCLEGTDCCDTYEYCISCCMRYDKLNTVQDTLISFAERGVAKEYLKNQFDLCTMACRTSSSSLLNQREYQNPKFKFCYGSNIAKV